MTQAEKSHASRDASFPLTQRFDSATLLYRAGAHAEQRIERTPANQPGQQGNYADPAPDANGACCRQRDEHNADYDAQDFVDATNICFHDVFRKGC